MPAFSENGKKHLNFRKNSQISHADHVFFGHPGSFCRQFSRGLADEKTAT